MVWRFPEIKFVKENTSRHQLDHVFSEYREVKFEIQSPKMDNSHLKRVDEEMADLLHSCETYFRIRQLEGADIHKIFSQVVEKNRKRGYYAE